MAATTQPIDIRPRPDIDFLTLAPVQSNSFPTPPASGSTRSSLSSSPNPDERAGIPAGSLPNMLKNAKDAKTAGESPAALKFLRLGPVHYGSDGGSDFAE